MAGASLPTIPRASGVIGAWGTSEDSGSTIHSTETLNRTITWNEQGQQVSSGSNVRSASATGSADAFYHRQWEDHWWLDAETWASGGTWQNATYDDYNYQYQWTKTWQGQGDGAVTSSASNHVTGLENGSESGWWTHTVPEGSGSGSSSSTSWGASWNPSYDTTVSYPGFWEARYYGRDYGGGSSDEDYIAYGRKWGQSPVFGRYDITRKPVTVP